MEAHVYFNLLNTSAHAFGYEMKQQCIVFELVITWSVLFYRRTTVFNNCLNTVQKTTLTILF